MSAAISKHQGAEMILASLPEQKALRQLEELSNAMFRVTTIPDAKRLVKMAEALAEAVRAMEASERLRRDSLAMVVRCERRLGALTAVIPTHVRLQHPVEKVRQARELLNAGKSAHAIGKELKVDKATIHKWGALSEAQVHGRASVSDPPKKEVLRAYGVNGTRAGIAEFLAKATDVEFELALHRAADAGSSSAGRVAAELGRVVRTMPNKYGAPMRLAIEAISLLRLCANKRRAPTHAEVKVLENRLALLNAEKGE